MINIYIIDNPEGTVFEDQECLDFFASEKIHIITDYHGVDVFVSKRLNTATLRTLKKLQRELMVCKPALIWTHEPRFSRTDAHMITLDRLLPIYVMNVYTGDVYLNHLSMYGKFVNQLLTPLKTVRFAPRPIVALATHLPTSHQPLFLNNINIDLSLRRQSLIYDGYDSGLVDIYGKDWPAGMTMGHSRGAGWHKSKLTILNEYQYNIALENTSFDYYCTEKIWDSIRGYCLPIYSSLNNRIYELFPEDSFIDVDQFPKNRDLYQYIRNLSTGRYMERLNRCIEVFNDIYENAEPRKQKQQVLLAIVDRIKLIHQNHQPFYRNGEE